MALAVARVVSEAEDYDVNISRSQFTSGELDDDCRDTLDELSKLFWSEYFLLLVDNCMEGGVQRQSSSKMLRGCIYSLVTNSLISR